MAKKEFTHNEVVAYEQRFLAKGLELIARQIEESDWDKDRILEEIRAFAYKAEEAAIDTDMRDSKGLMVTG